MKVVKIDLSPEDMEQHHFGMMRQPKQSEAVPQSIMPKEGAYAVYEIFPGGDSGEQKHFMGRVLFHDGNVHVLEDNRNFLSRKFPDGPVDMLIARRWYQLLTSQTFSIVQDEPRQTHQAPAHTEAYDVTDEHGNVQRLLTYPGDVLTLDGKRLSAQEAEQLFSKVRSHELMLVPK